MTDLATETSRHEGGDMTGVSDMPDRVPSLTDDR
jgi:hypothetical protein